MALRLKQAFGFISFIVVCVPNTVYKLNVKEIFYTKHASVAHYPHNCHEEADIGQEPA